MQDKLEDRKIQKIETDMTDQNAVDFFALLLKVDKRINPENYKQVHGIKQSSHA